MIGVEIKVSKEIKMPQLGQTSEEVKVLRWLVEEGQKVKRGQPLCEVETDKTTMELESFENGTVIKINVKPDTIVSSGTVIAVIGKAGEILEKDKNILSEGVPIEYSNEIKATGLVKNIAKNKSIDLKLVKGTGPNGLVTREDLENYEKTKLTSSLEAASESILPSIEEINLSQSQIAVARNLTRSKLEIPHYYLKSDIFADNILVWREKHKNPDGSKISTYSILIYAIAKTLKQIPVFNGYFKDNKIILHKEINVGFALSVGEELFVPVIKNADSKNISQIDRDLKSIISRANIKKFEAGDLSGGTFTITNLGMFGVDEFYAIINPLQSGIVAVGKLRKILHIDESDRMSIRSVLTITGSFDHRFVNGKSGAEFIGLFKNIIEEYFI